MQSYYMESHFYRFQAHKKKFAGASYLKAILIFWLIFLNFLPNFVCPSEQSAPCPPSGNTPDRNLFLLTLRDQHGSEMRAKHDLKKT